ncbi:ribosomal RNA processing protein 36 homolog isoform X1 [Mizuhopecten yessoensis]|uniref:ribosomal RNA processing protein 36 homolog isoform X1 n=2 Tax=Mizuhopecten yessoensis TaxID=6573 RepID=UPI000B45E56A|nr:ribosomal RNA processing protein 36 homolog isoform X1 [Mizuhopecten yessoensis]
MHPFRPVMENLIPHSLHPHHQNFGRKQNSVMDQHPVDDEGQTDDRLRESGQKTKFMKENKKQKRSILTKSSDKSRVTLMPNSDEGETYKSQRKIKSKQFSGQDDEMIHRKKTKSTKYKKEEDEFEESSEGEDVDEQSEMESTDEDINHEEYAAMREEIANMPFEDLIKLKERLGTKAYNKAMHKDKPLGVRGRQQFKRKNKNRPMEMSSKRRAPAVREIIPVKKKVNRDPRFDDLSGEFREDLFNKSYSFLTDIRVRERDRVQNQLKRVKDSEKKQDLHYLLNRMKQQEMATSQKQKRQDLEKKWKQKEKERVKEGKNPFYLKKGDLRKLELAEKYRELKKSGKVDNYLSKKRKKTASKEKKKLPLPAKQFGFT